MEQQVLQHATDPTALQWFKEFNLLWVTGIVPIVLAYIGYKTVQAKVNKINQKRFEETGGHEVGEETVMRYLKKKLHK